MTRWWDEVAVGCRGFVMTTHGNWLRLIGNSLAPQKLDEEVRTCFLLDVFV